MSLDKGVRRRERFRQAQADRPLTSRLWAAISPGLPQGLSGLPRVLAEVTRERTRQIQLWGAQSHEPAMWLAILTEEVGEVAKEVAEGRVKPFSDEKCRTELIHVAAVAAAAIEYLDRGVA